jgi:hypothetical protein
MYGGDIAAIGGVIIFVSVIFLGFWLSSEEG